MINILKKQIKIIQKLIEAMRQLLMMKKEKIPLRRLAEMMARMEGFYRTDTITLAQKNNNPLNIRPSKWYYDRGWIDKENNFVKFPTLEHGWAGCCWDLCYKCSRSKTLGPEATIKDLIYMWTATDQEIYLEYVCTQLNIRIDFKLKNFDLDSYC